MQLNTVYVEMSLFQSFSSTFSYMDFAKDRHTEISVGTTVLIAVCQYRMPIEDPCKVIVLLDELHYIITNLIKYMYMYIHKYYYTHSLVKHEIL